MPVLCLTPRGAASTVGVSNPARSTVRKSGAPADAKQPSPFRMLRLAATKSFRSRFQATSSPVGDGDSDGSVLAQATAPDDSTHKLELAMMMPFKRLLAAFVILLLTYYFCQVRDPRHDLASGFAVMFMLVRWRRRCTRTQWQPTSTTRSVPTPITLASSVRAAVRVPSHPVATDERLTTLCALCLIAHSHPCIRLVHFNRPTADGVHRDIEGTGQSWR